MSRRWRTLLIAATALLLLGLIASKPGSLSSAGARNASNGIPADSAISLGKELNPPSKSRPVNRKREQSRLLKALDNNLRQLEYSRITKTSEAVHQLKISDQVREIGRFPEDQESTPLNLRSVVVRAPGKQETETIRQLVFQTFASAAFEGEPDIQEQRQGYLDTYLNYPKKLKILRYSRLHVATNRESFAITPYNSEDYLEEPREAGTSLRPVDYESDMEPFNSQNETRQRYRHLFDLKE